MGAALSEFLSPPRIVDMAKRMGLNPGYSFDLTALVPGGRKLDFTRASDRLKASTALRHCRPALAAMRKKASEALAVLQQLGAALRLFLFEWKYCPRGVAGLVAGS